MAKTEVTIPLGIPDVRVLKSEAGARGEISITIENTKVGTSCRKCGQWITKLHGQEDKEELSYDRVIGVLERRIERSVDWSDMPVIEVLGLDEIALKEDQRNYVTLVSGRLCDGESLI